MNEEEILSQPKVIPSMEPEPSEKGIAVTHRRWRIRLFRADEGFSLTELMVVLVIIGVLVLLALPKLMPIITKAKTTEAKLMLKQVYTLEEAYKLEHDKYSIAFGDIGFEQQKLISEGGQARYKIEINTADEKGFSAQATSTVDFNGNGVFNVWVVDQSGNIVEKVPD
jgi:type IV pilus assembly protein PilE